MSSAKTSRYSFTYRCERTEIGSGEVEENRRGISLTRRSAQLASPSYRLAALDQDFLLSDSMRGVRFLLEYAKAEQELRAWGVRSTVVVFGSARVPSPEQAEAVRKGDQVVILARTATINVKMPGEALSDGAEGVDGDFIGENEYRGTANDGEGNNVALRLLKQPDGAIVTATFVYPEMLSEQYQGIAEKLLDSLRVFAPREASDQTQTPAAAANAAKP